MRYTWDAKKDRINKEKHGISFAQAVRISELDTYDQIDDREDYGEERMFAMGLYKDQVLVVIYVDRDDTRRIISARKAKRHEEAIFWQAKGRKPRQRVAAFRGHDRRRYSARYRRRSRCTEHRCGLLAQRSHRCAAS